MKFQKCKMLKLKNKISKIKILGFWDSKKFEDFGLLSTIDDGD